MPKYVNKTYRLRLGLYIILGNQAVLIEKRIYLMNVHFPM